MREARGAHGHDVAVVAEDRQGVGGQRRAATWNTVEVSSPAILNMFGIISSRPCDAVKVVARDPACNAPCMAPAAPPSLCISITVGTVPQMLGFPFGGPLVRPFAHVGGWRDGIDGDDFVSLMGNVCGRFVAVDEDLGTGGGG